MSPWTTTQAWNLKSAIEAMAPEDTIGAATEQLVASLGGTANVRSMTPGAAALYLMSLVLAQQDA